MAISMNLLCKETNLHLWIGDHREWNNPFGFQLFFAKEDCRKLERFLVMHRGKDIQMIVDDELFKDGREPVEFTDEIWQKFVAEKQKEDNERWISRGCNVPPQWVDKWERPDGYWVEDPEAPVKAKP